MAAAHALGHLAFERLMARIGGQCVPVQETLPCVQKLSCHAGCHQVELALSLGPPALTTRTPLFRKDTAHGCCRTTALEMPSK